MACMTLPLTLTALTVYMKKGKKEERTEVRRQIGYIKYKVLMSLRQIF